MKIHSSKGSRKLSASLILILPLFVITILITFSADALANPCTEVNVMGADGAGGSGGTGGIGDTGGTGGTRGTGGAGGFNGIGGAGGSSELGVDGIGIAIVQCNIENNYSDKP